MIPTILPYIENFRQKSLGLFIHYGPYIAYEHGEWVHETDRIDHNEYAARAIATDYSSFNANYIIESAKACGAKYVTFTTRHHDGFSLYDTRGLSDYDVMHTPNGKDIVKEFVDACHANDIMPFLYHTTLDWHHPAFDADFDRYQEYLKKSVEILCQNYGEIGGFWFDGNWSREAADWDLDGLYDIVRKNQPNAILINNTGLNAQGVYGHKEIDCVTYEQGTPQKLELDGFEKFVMGEMCYPLCDHWGVANDINLKSMHSILGAYLSARRVGGNLLLGIFTNIDGSQPLFHRGFLEAMGRFVKHHADALYLAKPTDIIATGNDFVLRYNNKLYFFFSEVPMGGDENVVKGIALPYQSFANVTVSLKSGAWMDTGENVCFVQDIEKKCVFIKPKPFAYGDSGVIRIAEFEF